MWYFMKRRVSSVGWRIFFVAFTIVWIAWCYFVVVSYAELSVIERLLHGAGIAILSPDLGTLFGRKDHS